MLLSTSPRCCSVSGNKSLLIEEPSLVFSSRLAVNNSAFPTPADASNPYETTDHTIIRESYLEERRSSADNHSHEFEEYTTDDHEYQHICAEHSQSRDLQHPKPDPCFHSGKDVQTQKGLIGGFSFFSFFTTVVCGLPIFFSSDRAKAALARRC